MFHGIFREQKKAGQFSELVYGYTEWARWDPNYSRI
jgi:hypothetical protein